MKAIDPINSFYDFQFAMTEYQRQKHPIEWPFAFGLEELAFVKSRLQIGLSR